MKYILSIGYVVILYVLTLLSIVSILVCFDLARIAEHIDLFRGLSLIFALVILK
jgi:hypothetical protein